MGQELGEELWGRNCGAGTVGGTWGKPWPNG